MPFQIPTPTDYLIFSPCLRNTQAGQRGYVKVYDRNGDSWAQIGGTLRGEISGENFGSNLSLSADGNHLLVGSPARDNPNIPGSVRYYELVPPGTYGHPHSPFGISSAADGLADEPPTAWPMRIATSGPVPLIPRSHRQPSFSPF